ncbi:MAG: 5-deoxy-glucuronate isomerase [Dictyoglomus sp. NZ13-RE01]|nr:MAG: 5-deoxy-glucuronate isomerase [Dictyoglomus sp. NZ13-RE01]
MFRKVNLEPGLNQLVKPGEMEFIEFDIFKGEKGDSYTFSSKDYEVGIIILTGRCNIKVDDISYSSLGARRNVFDGNAYSLYVPNNKEVTIEALENVEIAIGKTKVKTDEDVKLIKPEDVTVRNVGAGNWRRDVKDIIDKRIKAKRLLIGETINPPGNWSSYPPHKHDKDNYPYEVRMEEVYFYKLNPSHGFGLQRVYTQEGDIDNVYLIEDNSLLMIKRGYHPVVAAPGYQLYYLWILAGDTREQLMADDPKHQWIKYVEKILRELK